MKYAGFWHSIALPFTAAAKSEQLLLAFPCHFPASRKEVSSVFSLWIFPPAGHLDSSSSCILTRHFSLPPKWHDRQLGLPMANTVPKRVPWDEDPELYPPDIQPMGWMDHGIFPLSQKVAWLLRAWTRERGEETEIQHLFLLHPVSEVSTWR